MAYEIGLHMATILNTLNNLSLSTDQLWKSETWICYIYLKEEKKKTLVERNRRESDRHDSPEDVCDCGWLNSSLQEKQLQTSKWQHRKEVVLWLDSKNEMTHETIWPALYQTNLLLGLSKLKKSNPFSFIIYHDIQQRPHCHVENDIRV